MQTKLLNDELHVPQCQQGERAASVPATPSLHAVRAYVQVSGKYTYSKCCPIKHQREEPQQQQQCREKPQEVAAIATAVWPLVSQFRTVSPSRMQQQNETRRRLCLSAQRLCVLLTFRFQCVKLAAAAAAMSPADCAVCEWLSRASDIDKLADCSSSDIYYPHIGASETAQG